MPAVPLKQIQEARERIREHILYTPLIRSDRLSRLTGVDLTLKYENQQFTASFKERGAVNKLLLLSPEERSKGVVAASAGNHAQGIARHAGLLNIPIRIVMPRYTPNTKVESTKALGAEVDLVGDRFDESMQFTRELAVTTGRTLVHPFDDLDVIAGQGTIGVEILEQDPSIDTVIVPIGGGGLICGVVSAVKQIKPTIRVLGVQVDTFNTAYAMFYDLPPTEKTTAMTIAEGMAVKRPGEITGPMMKELLDDIVEVTEEEIEQAIFTLLEVKKTVVEGAGAAPLAALFRHSHMATGRTALLVTGGNIEMMVLANVIERGLVRSKRLIRLRVLVADIPGSLAKLTQHLGKLDSNIVDITHQRKLHTSTLGAQPIDVLIHLCGEEQADHVVEQLRTEGYEVDVLVN